MLRTLVRDKGTLVAEAGDWIGGMQKSLDPVNVRVRRPVSDWNGQTVLAILRAIGKASGIRGNWQNCAIRTAARAKPRSPNNSPDTGARIIYSV